VEGEEEHAEVEEEEEEDEEESDEDEDDDEDEKDKKDEPTGFFGWLANKTAAQVCMQLCEWGKGMR
jgi:hypothetical protein